MYMHVCTCVLVWIVCAYVCLYEDLMHVYMYIDTYMYVCACEYDYVYIYLWLTLFIVHCGIHCWWLPLGSHYLAGAPSSASGRLLVKALSFTIPRKMPLIHESCPWSVGNASSGAAYSPCYRSFCLQRWTDAWHKGLASWLRRNNSQMSCALDFSINSSFLCSIIATLN